MRRSLAPINNFDFLTKETALLDNSLNLSFKLPSFNGDNLLNKGIMSLGYKTMSKI